MFGDRLREARLRADISQRELGEKLHPQADQKTVSKWETGKSEPAFLHLVQLAIALCVSLDWLLGRTDDPERRLPPDAVEWLERAKIEGATQQELDLALEWIVRYLRRGSGTTGQPQ